MFKITFCTGKDASSLYKADIDVIELLDYLKEGKENFISILSIVYNGRLSLDVQDLYNVLKFI